jgi:hypothetical protein
MAVPAAWHGVSVEPLLGRIDIGDAKRAWNLLPAARAALALSARHECGAQPARSFAREY